jgi:hypothetical protein
VKRAARAFCAATAGLVASFCADTKFRPLNMHKIMMSGNARLITLQVRRDTTAKLLTPDAQLALLDRDPDQARGLGDLTRQ